MSITWIPLGGPARRCGHSNGESLMMAVSDNQRLTASDRRAVYRVATHMPHLADMTDSSPSVDVDAVLHGWGMDHWGVQ